MGTARANWLAKARDKQRPPPGDWFGWILLAGRGFGKGAYIGTLIPTPTGWTTFGDVKVGDQVFDEQGKVCNVTFVTPVRNDLKCYRMVFSDGTEIIVDEHHLWRTEQVKGKFRGQRVVSVVSTPEIKATLTHGKPHKGNNKAALNHAVRNAQPLELPPQPLLIDPYVLGAWLGDGTTHAPQICGADPQVFEEIEALGYTARMTPSTAKSAKVCKLYHITTPSGELFAHQLRRLGVLGNKHIPAQYLRGSYQQRLALLQGLMDTDGSISKIGTCYYGTVSPALRDGIYELIVSLGIKGTIHEKRARCNGKDYGPSWQIVFTAYFPVCRLKRKLVRQIAGGAQKFRQLKRFIVSVDEVPTVPTRCIQVDSASHLFLCTKSMIPTHNTRVGAEESWWWVVSSQDPAYRHSVVSATGGDLRRTVFEGDSGLLACIPEECLWEGHRKAAYNRANMELRLFTGGLIQGFAATEPERQRGPQFHSAWDDELAAWGTANTLQAMRDSWDMQMFGLRLGTNPRVMVTTTPKPFPLVMELMKRVGKDFVLTTGSSFENKENLAKSFFDQLMQYEGSDIGLQEIYAQIIDLEAGGTFKRKDFKLWPHGRPLPYFEYIIQSYDTAFTESTLNDPTACTTWGVFDAGKRYEVMLLDAWTAHMGMPELRERAFREYGMYYGAERPVPDRYDSVVIKPGTMKNPLIGQGAQQALGRKVDEVLIEAIGSGISLIQELDRKGIPTRSYNPGNQDKALRGHVVSHLPPNGMVWIPESSNRPGHFASWAEDLLYELCVKRTPDWEIAHDDLYDTFTQAMRRLIDMGWLRVGDEVSLKQESDHDRPAKRRNPYLS